MKNILLIAFPVTLFLSCSKSNSTSNGNPPPTDTTASPNTRIPSLYNPVPIDTIGDWVRIGRVVYNAEDIWFTSGTTGFITDDTSLYKTIDNGVTWTKIPNTSYPNIFNLQFVDDQNGFVQGVSELGITNDGGNTWTFKSIPPSAIYFQFVSANNGFLACFNGGLQKTNDAGSHWVSVSKPYLKNRPFYFLDSLRGFCLDNGDFSKTIDGGNSWNTIKPQALTFNDKSYYKMQFLDSLTGYCATLTGLSKTTDGGITWTNSLPASPSLMVPYFFDANHGYCISDSTMYKTTDGGANWQISCKLSGDRFSGVHFLDINIGWASTFDGYILRLK